MKSSREKRKVNPWATAAWMSADSSDADLQALSHWDAKGTLLGQPVMWMVAIRCGVRRNYFAALHLHVNKNVIWQQLHAYMFHWTSNV